MSRRAKNLRDWWIFAAGSIGGLTVALSAAISLAKGLDSVSSDLIALLVGLPAGLVNLAAWRDAEIERMAIRKERDGGSDA